eukprot:TRINITY_DN333_c0_g1_i1.p1 TRINITY_DN333_c0_g1~~TRINITY_DN333_c0_g1_i1.p1  ORF type:complete len:558 (+),score=177.41 TRINITY_DN333_c0_g1_i1:31-1704(+)
MTSVPQLVECVPNFSEGRDKKVIKALSEAISNTPGCSLLDVDPGESTNRTVITFVGSPKAVVEGALASARVAAQMIDMTKHKGAHPRNGAMDVVPFVPVSGVDMKQCIELANEFASRLAKEMSLPSFLYEEAAVKGTHRVQLLQLRSGEYEALSEKLKQKEWEPDYGPKEFVPKWGISQVGARKFLIAYNVNVLGTKEQAHKFALNIREQGRGPTQPGKFKKVKSIGWWVDEYKMAQVSINLEDFKVTSMHDVFEEVKKEAEEMDIAICGSEIVGLVPLEALLMAADFYIKKEKLFILEDHQKVALAMQRLGLSAVKPFNPKTRIIEYMCKKDAKDLADVSVRDFIHSVAARTPAPGGGSVSAIAVSHGLALGQMMAWMSFGTVQWQQLDSTMRKLIPPLDKQVKASVPLIDEDTQAFNAVMKAFGLPKETKEQQTTRDKAIQAAYKLATEVPLSVMRLGSDKEVWTSLVVLSQVGNLNSQSDLEVGVKMLETGVWGASRNVKINLKNITDTTYVAKVKAEVEKMLEFVHANVTSCLKLLQEREETEEKKKASTNSS